MIAFNKPMFLVFCMITSVALVTLPVLPQARSASSKSAAAGDGQKPNSAVHSSARPSAHGDKLSPGVHFLSYAQASAVIQSFADELPAELKGRSAAELEKFWPQYVREHDGETRGRLEQGEEDSLNNLVLFGTSFTSQPRLTAEFIEQQEKAQGSRGQGEKETGAAAGVPQENSDAVVRVFVGRVNDFIRALEAPGKNERLLYMRHFLERRGYGLATAPQQQQLQQYLLANFQRTHQEFEKYQRVLAAARKSGDLSNEFAARSTLFQTRGVSLDTSLMPNFALEQALGQLLEKGLLAKASVHRVAIIGPGLDFVDKQEGYDFYPQQTIQPFLVMDSLFRLGLAQSSDLHITTLDISARVNDHIAQARARARNQQSYVMQLPLESQLPNNAQWSPAALAYWKAAGMAIGNSVAPLAPPREAGPLQLRAVKIAPQHVLRITPVDLDVVYQNLELAPGQRFDLIIATNMFTYYGQFEQSLAMANLENMIRPGGFLLTNNGLPENVPVALQQAGFSTTPYSDRPSDGDHIIWYRRAASDKQ